MIISINIISRCFLSADGQLLLGCIRSEQVKQVPREQWGMTNCQELVKPCSTENTISPQTDTVRALSIMSRTGNSRLMVVDAGTISRNCHFERYAEIPRS